MYAWVLALVTVTGLASAVTRDEASQLQARAREIYLEDGPRPALPVFEQALALHRQAGDRLGEAITLGLIGNCHKRLADYPLALQYLGTAVAMKRELGDRLEEGKTLSHIGLVYWEMGQYSQAIDHFQEAMLAGRETPDLRLEGSALNNLSLVYDELGDYAKSLEGYERVLELYGQTDFPRGESDTLANIGGVYLLLGQYRRAMDYYKRAEGIDRHLGLKPALSSSIGNTALCHLGLGEIEEALEGFESAIELAHEGGLRQEEAYFLKGKANAMLLQGKYDFALDLHRQVLGIYEETGSRGELVEALSELGELYLQLGDLARAEEQFDRALETAEKIGKHRGVTQSLLALGELRWYRRQYSQAVTFYQRALVRAEAVGDRVRTAEALSRLAKASRDLGQFETALETAGKALESSRQAGLPLQEARSQLVLGEIERARDQPDQALKHYAAGQKIATRVGDPDLLWRLHFGMAQALSAAGQKEDAVEALKKAVEVIDSVRYRLREERFRAGYLEDKYNVYVELVRLLLELERVEEAFSASEMLRSRSFLELIDRAPQLWPNSGEDRRRLSELQSRIRLLQNALEDERSVSITDRRQPAIETFSLELAAAEREFQDLLDDLRSRTVFSSRHASRRYGSNDTRVHALLSPDSALLEYLVSKDELIIFTLTAEGLQATTIDVRSSDLRTKVELLRGLLLRPESSAWRKPARSLAELLVRPIEREGWLDGISHLYIVPHGVLHYLPFALLPRGSEEAGRFLIEDYVLSYLPAAAVLDQGDETRTLDRSLLAFAPDRSKLRHVQDEVHSIGNLISAQDRVVTGSMATEESFKRLASEYQVLHLATHGVFNHLNPLLSSLELESSAKDDGNLQVYEILDLTLDADLVTLSACDTALASGFMADVPAGDEFVGLTRAFLLAGSAAVMSSLWEVRDRFTADFMVDFYRGLELNSNAYSLAQVQRKFLGSDSRYRHPYYWSPFVLIGDVVQNGRNFGKTADEIVKAR